VLPAGLKLAVILGAERSNSPLALSTSRLPRGLAATFSKPTLEAGGGVVLTLSAERSARLGSFTIDVIGSSAGSRISVPIQLHVVEGGESPQPTAGCTSATAAWEAMIGAAVVALACQARRRRRSRVMPDQA
jgi:ABC-type enterobactin transport system permease subunit